MSPLSGWLRFIHHVHLLHCVSKNVPSLTGYNFNIHSHFYNFWHVISRHSEIGYTGLTFSTTSLILHSCCSEAAVMDMMHTVTTSQLASMLNIFHFIVHVFTPSHAHPFLKHDHTIPTCYLYSQPISQFNTQGSLFFNFMSHIQPSAYQMQRNIITIIKIQDLMTTAVINDR